MDFNEARDDGWQWHQLDHVQIICTSLQTDKHASTSPLSFCRPDALPATQLSVKALKAQVLYTYQIKLFHAEINLFDMYTGGTEKK